MALVTGLSPISSPTDMLREYEITSVDDDIIETINKLFTFGQTGVMSQEAMEETIGKAVQAERNHWKAILKSSEMEKDSFHKIIRKNQDSLQRLMNSLKFSWRAPKKESTQLPETIQEDQPLETDIVTENLATDNILISLKFRVDQLKLLAGIDEEKMKKRSIDTKPKYSEADIEYLKNALAKFHFEKEALKNQLSDKDKEIQWLQKEVSSAKNHAAKLDKIINNYNENHTGANFHLDDVEIDTERNSSRKEKHITARKERTYIEGDQLQAYPLPKEEVAMWKVRLQQNVHSNRRGDAVTGITKCFRCQKLFKPGENNNKACRFHQKGREIKEHYDDNGKLTNVDYKWACCKNGLESRGCAYGFHV